MDNSGKATRSPAGVHRSPARSRRSARRPFSRGLLLAALLALVLPGALAPSAKADADTGGLRAPVDLRVPPMAFDEKSITLAWAKPASHVSIVDYHVYVRGRLVGAASADPGSAAKPYVDAFYADPANAAQVRTVNDSFTVTGLRPASRYTFTVRSVDSAGRESRDSAPVTATTTPVPRVFNVLDYGAVGDGTTMDTKAIQAAIDACTPGGKVLIPAGRFLSGALWLKSDMTFEVGAGGTLLGSPDAADYPYRYLLYDYSTDPRFYSLLNAHTYQYGSLHDIRIVGAGTIDGNGWKQGPPDADGFPAALPSSSSTVATNGILAASETAAAAGFGSASPYGTRSNLITARGVRNLYLGGFTAVNPAEHDLVFIKSQNVTVAGVRMLTGGVNNGDGIDFTNSSGLTVVGNVFDTGDDDMNFAAGLGAAAANDPPSRDAWIAGNYFRHGHGAVVAGSHTGAWIEDITAEDNVINGTDIGLRMKTDPHNGSGARRVLFRDNALKNLTMQGFIFTSTYADAGAAIVVEPAPTKAIFEDVTVRHVTVDGAAKESINVVGAADAYDRNLRFDDVQFVHAKQASLNYLSGSVFHDVVFADLTSPWKIANSTGLSFTGTTTASAVTTDAQQVPAWPAGAALRATADDTTATLTWPAASDDTGVSTYTVLSGDTPVATVPGTAGGFQVTGLAPALAYRFQVVANDVTGNATPGPSVSVTTTGTQDTAAPTVPTGDGSVSVVAASVGTTWLRVVWQAATDDYGIAGYEVEANGAPVATVPAGTLGYTIGGLRPGTPYTLAVVALDATGNRAAYPVTAPATTKPPYDTSVPSWPAGRTVTATAIGTTSVSLQWTQAQDDQAVAGYRVYVNGAPVPAGTAFTPVDTGATTAGTTYTVTGLTPGTRYTVTVRAGDAAGKWTSDGPSVTLRTGR